MMWSTTTLAPLSRSSDTIAVAERLTGERRNKKSRARNADRAALKHETTGLDGAGRQFPRPYHHLQHALRSRLDPQEDRVERTLVTEGFLHARLLLLDFCRRSP